MAIKIGDNNNIKKSNIIDNSNNNNINQNNDKESFASKHPWITGIIISIIASIILMIPFWDKVKEFLENIF